MDEGDLEPEEPLPRRAIDQLRSRRLELVERRVQVARGERDVVHSRPAAREEASDRRVVTRRRDELEATLADEHRRCFDTLPVKWLAVLESRMKESFVGRDRFVEIGHRKAEMMDPTHSLDATRGPALTLGVSH